MTRSKSVNKRILVTLFFVILIPLTNAAWAQTPEAPTEPPVVTEVPTEVPSPPAETPAPTEVPPPPPTEVPAPPTAVPTETQVPPTAIPPTAIPPTEVPVEAPVETAAPTTTVETPEATQTPVVPTEEPNVATPTPTQEVIEPDQLALVSDPAVTIAPGESRDITVRYTLGSDRIKTGLTASIVNPGEVSLEGWSLESVSHADGDPAVLAVRIDETGAIKRSNTFDVTLRLTAPAHIETPVALNISFGASIHREDGVTDGAVTPGLVSVSATASVHNPTLACGANEGETNSWKCVFDTTHPDAVAMKASVQAPAGWDLKLNSAAKLTGDPAAVDAAVVQSGQFSLSAEYPIGCPDTAANTTTTLSLELTYPSGEIRTLTQDLNLVFERPTPSLTVSSFEFTEFNMLESLSTTGSLTLAYADAPCDWVATIELADLHSDQYTVTNAAISITGTEGREDATITIADGTITIQAPGGAKEVASGEITINLQIDLPHPVPPGAYVIGVVTEIRLKDEL